MIAHVTTFNIKEKKRCLTMQNKGAYGYVLALLAIRQVVRVDPHCPSPLPEARVDVVFKENRL